MADVKYKIDEVQMYGGIVYNPDSQGYALIPRELAETLEAADKVRSQSDEFQEEVEKAQNALNVDGANLNPSEANLNPSAEEDDLIEVEEDEITTPTRKRK